MICVERIGWGQFSQVPARGGRAPEQLPREATYKDGVLDGMGRRFASGDGWRPILKNEIPWVKGKMQGVMRSFHPDGKVAGETPYENGQVHGKVCSYDAEGNLTRTASYSRGQRDEESVDYWPDRPGEVQKTVPYRKGKVHGVAKEFYPNGKLKWERPFRNNLEHGKETQYAPDGTLERSVYWLEGERVSEDEYRKGTE